MPPSLLQPHRGRQLILLVLLTGFALLCLSAVVSPSGALLTDMLARDCPTPVCPLDPTPALQLQAATPACICPSPSPSPCPPAPSATALPTAAPPSTWTSHVPSQGPGSDQERIIILQHFSTHEPRLHVLQNHSIAQHERYAGFWGYDYRTSYDQFVYGADKSIRQRQANKVYALLDLALGEMAKGYKGADWIFITDADVLIHDPLIPLHALLPSPSTLPDAFILGAEDNNGFNSANTLFRSGPDLVHFLTHALALSDSLTRTYESHLATHNGTAPKELETPPSDQRALCLVLRDNPAYGERFYHYRQAWLNAYPDKEMEEDGIHWNSHMVAGTKYKTGKDLEEVLRPEKEGWERLQKMGWEELRGMVDKVREQTRRYWEKEAKRGAPKCFWL